MRLAQSQKAVLPVLMNDLRRLFGITAAKGSVYNNLAELMKLSPNPNFDNLLKKKR